MTRLFVDADLGPGATIDLAPGQAHYLRHVLRLEAGEAVQLFNGRDGEWRARLDGFGKGKCSIAVADQTRPQRSELDLWLVFAPIKRERIDWLAAKATELGVTALLPAFTRRTAVTRVNTDRLRANAVEAAEQCERLTVPDVREAATLDRILADWPPRRRLLLCAEAGTARPIADALVAEKAALAAAGRAAPEPWAVLTGPEGGFAPDELDALVKLAFVTAVGLGPRLLRADTAAVAALACWQAVLGDGAGRPPLRPGGRQPA